MRCFLCFLLAVLCLAGMLSGCGSTEEASPTNETTTSQETTTMDNKTCSILFIGNSYTFYNDMPTAYFEVIGKTCGYDMQVTAITKGAYTLAQFADPTDNYGKLVAQALSVPGTYDYVILQEQSVRPAIDTAPQFYDGVRKLAAMIREAGAQPVLYSTWGRKTGSDTLEKYSLTNESMTWKLAAAYSAIGAELDIPVIHVGLAFYDVYTNSQIELYNADRSHPSPIGSYLAAITLFCGIFQLDPVEAPFTGPADPEDDGILRSAARKVIFETPAIPQEYATTSQNVTAN